MKQYQFFLFDWDGCLADTLSVWLKAYQQTFKTFELQPTIDQIVGIFGDWEGSVKIGVKESDHQQFNQLLIKAAQKGMKTANLNPGAKNLLSQIPPSHKGIVSSSDKLFIQNSLKRHQLNQSFKTIIAHQDVQNHKPHPEPLHLALQELQANYQNTLMIGDSISDIQAAHAAHIDVALYFPEKYQNYYHLSIFQTENPTYIIKHFKELEAAL